MVVVVAEDEDSFDLKMERFFYLCVHRQKEKKNLPKGKPVSQLGKKVGMHRLESSCKMHCAAWMVWVDDGETYGRVKQKTDSRHYDLMQVSQWQVPGAHLHRSPVLQPQSAVAPESDLPAAAASFLPEASAWTRSLLSRQQSQLVQSEAQLHRMPAGPEHGHWGAVVLIMASSAALPGCLSTMVCKKSFLSYEGRTKVGG